MAEKIRVIFMGTPDFAVPSLYRLSSESAYELIAVITQPDRPKGRGQKRQGTPVKEAALERGLPLCQPESIKEESFLEYVKGLSPDLIVVVAFGQILPQRLLELPRLGCINLHASLLPAYRGAAPIHWAILNGEKETGVTTMLMDSGLDTGDILLAEKIPLAPTISGGELHDLLAQTGANLLLKTIELWRFKQIQPQSQQGLRGSYAPLLKREHELIDWTETAEKIYNQIRALQPKPGAVTFFKGQALKIINAQLHDAAKTAIDEPGAVLQFKKGQGFIVQTGQGTILVTSLQPHGKKIMSAESFINGYHLEVGYVFHAD